MPLDFEARGSRQLATIGRRLKDAGEGKLRRQLLAAIRGSAEGVIPDIQASARRTLPKSGGLAERVASQVYGVRTSLASSGGRVSLVGRGMKELRDIDRGRLRHPVFGNRGVWRAQSVTPGFASQAAVHRVPKIRLAIAVAMRHAAEEIGRSI